MEQMIWNLLYWHFTSYATGSIGSGSNDFRRAKYARDHGSSHPHSYPISDPMSALPSNDRNASIFLFSFYLVIHCFLSLLSFSKVLLVHEASKGTFSRVFDFDEAGDVDKADPGSGTRWNIERNPSSTNFLKSNFHFYFSPQESRFPINVGITSYVATTGEVTAFNQFYKNNLTLTIITWTDCEYRWCV